MDGHDGEDEDGEGEDIIAGGGLGPGEEAAEEGFHTMLLLFRVFWIPGRARNDVERWWGDEVFYCPGARRTIPVVHARLARWTPGNRWTPGGEG